jgi:hypothetical protein
MSGPLPRTAFRSFLATASDPSPKLRGRGVAERSRLDDWLRSASAGTPLPDPPPQTARGRENGNVAAGALSNSPPLPRQRGRGPGGGGLAGASQMPVAEPRSVARPTSPRVFWGRCEPERAEGACPSRGTILRALLLLVCALLVSPLAAQAPNVTPTDAVAVVGTQVDPDSATVGDRFRAAVFVRAPAGARVELVVPPSRDGSYQTVDSVRGYPPDSTGLHRAVATMVLWTTQGPNTARAEVRVTLPGGGARTLPVGLPLPAAHAVLPADSARPRPPKDIILIPRRSWTWAYVAAAVLAAALLVAWWMMRRRRRPAVVVAADPRQHALAELDRLRASSPIESADVEAFSAAVSVILRDFAAAADPALGPDLTTQELLDHLRRTGAREEDVGSVADALMHADLAKFARRRPTPERAIQDWEAARRWVSTFRAAEAEAGPVLVEAGR